MKLITQETRDLFNRLDKQRVADYSYMDPKTGKRVSMIRDSATSRYSGLLQHMKSETDDNSWEIREVTNGALAMGQMLNGKFEPWFVGRSGAFETDELVRRAKIVHYRNARRLLTELDDGEADKVAELQRQRRDCARESSWDIYNGAKGKQYFTGGAYRG